MSPLIGIMGTAVQQTELIPSGPGAFPSPEAKETPTNSSPRSHRG